MSSSGSGGFPSTADLKKVRPVTEERRLELLAMARASRIQWVVEASEKRQSRSKASKQPVPPEAVQRSDTSSKIPIAPTMQSVLNFLTEVIDDREYIHVDSLVPLACYDEFEIENDHDEVPSSYPPSMTPYEVFTDKLRRPMAADIVKLMQQYVLKCKTAAAATGTGAGSATAAAAGGSRSKPTGVSSSASNSSTADGNGRGSGSGSVCAPASPGAIWSFLTTQLFPRLKSCPLWAAESPAQFEAAKEHLERFLHGKLFGLTFGAMARDEEGRDRALFTRIRSLSFLTPDHLDIRSLQLHDDEDEEEVGSGGGDSVEALLSGPMEHLLALSALSCPNDMMAAIKAWASSTMQVLTEVKKRKQDRAKGTQSAKKGGGGSAPPGADEFLSLLILSLQRCCGRAEVSRAADGGSAGAAAGHPLAQLYTIQKYLQAYLAPHKLSSESGYLLAQFVSAVHFLEYADASSLTISPEEFQLALDASKTSASSSIARSQQQHRARARSSSGGEDRVAEQARDLDPAALPIAWVYAQGGGGGAGSGGTGSSTSEVTNRVDVQLSEDELKAIDASLQKQFGRDQASSKLPRTRPGVASSAPRTAAQSYRSYQQEFAEQRRRRAEVGEVQEQAQAQAQAQAQQEVQV